MPMNKLANLSMESTKVDTSLAKKYMTEHQFENFPPPGELWVFNNDPNQIQKMPINDYEFSKDDDPTWNRVKLRQLANIIEQNEVLFCQLEHEIRNIDPADVKNSIILMSQHLQCPDSLWVEPNHERDLFIRMCEETPLHVLGCVAYTLQFEARFAIVSCKTTAPLCHLFVQRCSQIGLKIPLLFVDNPEKVSFTSLVINVTEGINENGCTGVVTEQADVDSALDVLIYSSTKAPWRFRRVYVQESIYEEFKSSLAWKCERQVASGDVFTARGKTFSCDPLRESSHSEISVEAYRTVKELLTLMKRQSAPFLSVWAEGSELSHEIAFGADADYVWLNDYAAFSGPPLASCPVYASVYATARSPDTVIDHPTGNSWWKRKDDGRKDIMIKTLQARSQLNSDRLLRVALDWRRDSFVHHSEGRICLGVGRPLAERSLIHLDVMNDDDLVNVIKLSLSGHIVVCDCYGADTLKAILDSQGKSDVPVLNKPNITPIDKIQFPKRYKVIQSRFGTVFAN